LRKLQSFYNIRVVSVVEAGKSFHNMEK